MKQNNLIIILVLAILILCYFKCIKKLIRFSLFLYEAFKTKKQFQNIHFFERNVNFNRRFFKRNGFLEVLDVKKTKLHHNPQIGFGYDLKNTRIAILFL